MKLFTNPSGSDFIEFAAPLPRSSVYTTETATRLTDGQWTAVYQVLQNPDPVLRKTGAYIDILDELKREAQVSACSVSRESGVLLRQWKIEQDNASSSSCELIEKLLKSLPMRDIMREILEAWGYGYQISEVVWQREGDLFLPSIVAGKPRRWFFFGSENNELRKKSSSADIVGEPVPPRKFLLTKYRASYDNPYGEAQYSMCFWPVTFKKGGLKFWAQFLERFGSPHAVGKLPRNANPKERDELLGALRAMIRDAAAVFPDDASVELLSYSVSNSADAYENYARYHDGQISTVILGHAGAANSTPGRLGNDTSAMDVRADIIENDAAMVQDTINTLIKWIYEFNPSLGELPKFKIYEENDVDKERADRDVALLNTGKVKLTKGYYLKNYDFDDDDIEVVEPQPEQSAAPQFSKEDDWYNKLSARQKDSIIDFLKEGSYRPQFSKAAPAGLSDDEKQNEIDLLNIDISNSSQKQIEALLKPVFELIDKSESFDEVITKITELYPNLDDKEISDVVEKAMFLSNVLGRV